MHKVGRRVPLADVQNLKVDAAPRASEGGDHDKWGIFSLSQIPTSRSASRRSMPTAPFELAAQLGYDTVWIAEHLPVLRRRDLVPVYARRSRSVTNGAHRHCGGRDPFQPSAAQPPRLRAGPYLVARQTGFSAPPCHQPHEFNCPGCRWTIAARFQRGREVVVQAWPRTRSPQGQVLEHPRPGLGAAQTDPDLRTSDDLPATNSPESFDQAAAPGLDLRCTPFTYRTYREVWMARAGEHAIATRPVRRARPRSQRAAAYDSVPFFVHEDAKRARRSFKPPSNGSTRSAPTSSPGAGAGQGLRAAMAKARRRARGLSAFSTTRPYGGPWSPTRRKSAVAKLRRISAASASR